MPTVPYRVTSPEDSLETFLEKVARLTSTRKVRPVITPSGKRARGNMPSIKAPGRARYESLLELDVLRVAEVSSKIRVLRTHPPGRRLNVDTGGTQNSVDLPTPQAVDRHGG